MPITCEKVILNFIDGIQEGEKGSISSTTTVKVRGSQLLHYETPIIERTNDCFILNMSRYSIATGQLQKRIKNILPDGYQIVTKVPQGYHGSLRDYLDEKV